MASIDAFKQKVLESLKLVKDLAEDAQEEAAKYLSDVLGGVAGKKADQESPGTSASQDTVSQNDDRVDSGEKGQEEQNIETPSKGGEATQDGESKEDAPKELDKKKEFEKETGAMTPVKRGRGRPPGSTKAKKMASRIEGDREEGEGGVDSGTPLIKKRRGRPPGSVKKVAAVKTEEGEGEATPTATVSDVADDSTKPAKKRGRPKGSFKEKIQERRVSSDEDMSDVQEVCEVMRTPRAGEASDSRYGLRRSIKKISKPDFIFDNKYLKQKIEIISDEESSGPESMSEEAAVVDDDDDEDIVVIKREKTAKVKETGSGTPGRGRPRKKPLIDVAIPGKDKPEDAKAQQSPGKDATEQSAVLSDEDEAVVTSVKLTRKRPRKQTLSPRASEASPTRITGFSIKVHDDQGSSAWQDKSPSPKCEVVSMKEFAADGVKKEPKSGPVKEKKNSVKSQVKTNEADPNFEDRVCPETVTSREELKIWTSLLCPVCYQVQPTGKDLIAHKMTHQEIVPCPQCSRQFTSQKSYQRHSVSHIPDDGPFKCPLCSKETYQSKDVLIRHARTCVGEISDLPVIECPWCSMGFNHISHLYQHQTICDGILPFNLEIPAPEVVAETGLIKCDVCDRDLHPSVFSTHRYKHAYQTLKNCRVCGRGFPTFTLRVAHEKKHPSFEPKAAKDSIISKIREALPPKSEWPEKFTAQTEADIADALEGMGGMSKITSSYPVEEEEEEINGEDGVEVAQPRRGRKPKSIQSTGAHVPSMEEIQVQVYDNLVENGKIDLPFDEWKNISQATNSKLCEICGKTFKNSCEKKVHLMTHLNIRPFACDSCDKKFVTYQQMMRHRDLHTIETNVKCSLCPKKFRTRLQMARHRQTHYFEKNPLECPTCHKFFRGPRILKLHQQIHKGGKFRQWQCDICEKWFHQQYVLAIHRNLVHKIEGPVEDQTNCVTENDTAASEVVIQQEIEKRKVGPKQQDDEPDAVKEAASEAASKRRKLPIPKKHFNLYVCNICDRKMSSYSAMKVHLMQHNGIRPYSCPQCPDKTFITRQNLQKHITCCHEMTGSVACEICGRKVKEHYYDRHMEKHSRQDYRPVPCPMCEMRFYDHRTLKRHMQIHTKTSPNLCDLCGQTLSNPYQLKMHKKRHLGQLEHICNICGRGFVSKNVLQQHQWVHTKNRPKPYVCRVCERAFCTRRVLNGHCKREHGLIMGRYVCNHCQQDFGDEKPKYIQHVAQCNREKRLREKAGYPTTVTYEEPVGATIAIPNNAIEAEEATVVIASGGEALVDGTHVIEAEGLSHETLIAHLLQQQNIPESEVQIIEEEVVEEEEPSESVQYVFVDDEGNVLETIEGNAGDFVVKTEDVEGGEQVVTYTVAGRGEDGQEVYEPMTVLYEETLE